MGELAAGTDVLLAKDLAVRRCGQTAQEVVAGDGIGCGSGKQAGDENRKRTASAWVASLGIEQRRPGRLETPGKRSALPGFATLQRMNINSPVPRPFAQRKGVPKSRLEGLRLARVLPKEWS